MRFLARLTTAGVLLVLLAAVGASPAAAAPKSPVVGHLYVNDNSAGTNNVADR